MTKFITNIFFLLLYLFFCQTLLAQKTEICGIVADSVSLKPIEGVVVKAFDGKKMIAFTTTNKSGNYRLVVENQISTFLVSFQQIAYTEKTQLISNKSQYFNINLCSKTVILKEVIVKSPIVLVKNDTVSFNVESFKTASDRSIEDVIKKLPGVKVTTDGKIAYQGKDISKFNIEGMDMLGGKYTLASQNIQAKDVSRVEVIENYQEVKQLQGKEYSDKVAMNLKLTKEAQMHLLGTMELGSGSRENEELYHSVLTTMAFSKKAQFIGTLKANNFGEPLSNEAMDHFGRNDIYNVADRLIGSDLATGAPLAFNRYQKKNDLLTSLNSVFKLSEDKTLRVNLDYNREQSNYQYDTKSVYSLNNNTVEIVEQQSPQYLNSSLCANLNYLINSPKLYLYNNTFISMRDVDNHFGLITNGNQIQQLKTNRLLGVKNELSFLKKIRKMQYNFNSIINYSYLPDNRLTFLGVPNITNDYYQMSQGKSFFTKEAVSCGYYFGKLSRLSVASDVQINYDKVFTQLQRNDSAILNKNDGYKIVLSVWPEYQFLSADQRYGFTLGMPVNMYNLSYKNHINSDADFYFNRLYFNFWLNAHYVFSPFTKLEIHTSFNNSIGDINDFIINPIQTSYINQSVRSGILAINRSFSSAVNVEYKNPLQLFFVNGSVSYGSVKRNILNSQIISTGSSTIGINSSGIFDSNISQNGSISGKVSKNLRDVSTSFSLSANYGISSGNQLRQGVKTNVNSNSVSVSPNVRTQISKRLEIDYSMSFSQSTLNTINLSTTYHQQSHNLNLSYNPVDAIVIYGSMDFIRSEIAPKNFKNMQFMDAGVRYKCKKIETELKLNNILNTNEYSYTIISDLDRFSYNYHLNSREIVLVCKFNL